MRSKTSKRSRTPAPSPWRDAPGSAEADLPELTQALARELGPGDRVLLEGPLGAGKTTFARHLLSALGVIQAPEGSPSFAIAHEYDSRAGEVVHLDFYRLSRPEEIEEAGIQAYFWEKNAIVICEWLSLFPEFEKSVLDSAATEKGKVWRVELKIPEGRQGTRDLRIFTS